MINQTFYHSLGSSVRLSDYEDYYTGSAAHSPHQKITVDECDNNDCSTQPTTPGTWYHDQAPPPGVYYVGVYNDARLANEEISSYSLKATVTGTCVGDNGCADGFVGANDKVNVPSLRHLPSPTPLSAAP